MDIVSRRAAGQSIKSIARELGVSRNTVRATLRREGPPRYERRPGPSKLDAHKDYLVARLADFPELSAKQLLGEIRATATPAASASSRTSRVPTGSPGRARWCASRRRPANRPSATSASSASTRSAARARDPPVRHGPRLLALHVRRSGHRRALADLPRLPCPRLRLLRRHASRGALRQRQDLRAQHSRTVVLRIPRKPNARSTASRTLIPLQAERLGAKRRVCLAKVDVLFGFRSTRSPSPGFCDAAIHH